MKKAVVALGLIGLLMVVYWIKDKPMQVNVIESEVLEAMPEAVPEAVPILEEPQADVEELIVEELIVEEPIEETPIEVSFARTLFIGDSRTEGFQIQSGITEGKFLTHKGLMVNTAMTEAVIREGDKKITVLQAASKGNYDRIFIMLGINELGWAYESVFIETYKTLIDALKTAQPSAEIYVQSIIKVSSEKSQKDAIYNNPAIDRYNALIQAMTQEMDVHFIDLNEVLSDEKGNLFSDASFDGVHLKPAYCQKWLAYLITYLKGETE